MSSDRARSPGILLTLFLVAAGAPFGCADWSRGEPSPPLASDGGAGGAAGHSGAATSFAADVLPLLAPCRTCHVTGGQAGETALLFTGDASKDYATVSRFVDTTSPAGSRLLSKASGNGHGGGTIYAAGSPQYQTILTWIQQGAPP